MSRLKLSILFFLIFACSGCAIIATIHIDTASTPKNKPNNKNGQKNLLLVGDYRENEKIFRTDAQAAKSMHQSPIYIIWLAYRNALSDKGYSINSSAPYLLKVELKEFYVTWPIGMKVPVPGEVKTQVKFEDQSGNCIIDKEFSYQETEIASGGGVVGKIPGRILQKCLNEVIELSLNDELFNNSMKSPVANK
ncbi:MAG: hypothetical protein GY795_13295 [Desulfobacterales bacterium]|nr:hypothetical protein [Desulfobacterales bacterium]